MTHVLIHKQRKRVHALGYMHAARVTGGVDRRLNVNVGVLGHVDSGKTSLVAALSTTVSTAALDKHPQSQERGITLDLGFSNFTAPTPEHLAEAAAGSSEVQMTLVDCPGHATLIRTVMCGARIIDIVLLVLDVTKGIQTQTAECIVVAEAVTPHLIVALNKVDLLPSEGRTRLLSRVKKRLAATFRNTRYAGCVMVPVAARPGGDGPPEGVADVSAALLRVVPTQLYRPQGPLQVAVDHCFSLRGRGTVLTGTVLQGQVSVGDSIELPELRLQRKVRSIQVFRQAVQEARCGDRAAIAVTQLEAATVERCLLAAPGSVPSFSAAIARVDKIRFYVGNVKSKSRMHVSVGHVTLMSELAFFGLPDASQHADADLRSSQPRPTDTTYPAKSDATQAASSPLQAQESAQAFDLGRQYQHQEQLYGAEGRPPDENACNDLTAGGTAQGNHFGPQWALLRFSQPVVAPEDSGLIGSKLDAEASGAACRLAFCGHIVAILDTSDSLHLKRLQIFRWKRREGIIERVTGFRSAVCRGMFKKETDISVFAGMQVISEEGVSGTLAGSFGKSGKFSVKFDAPVESGSKVVLLFKKFLFQTDKRIMAQ